MSDKVNYPTLEWRNIQYWGNVIAFLLLISVIGILSYNIAPQYNFPSTILAYIQVLFLYAIHERQKLLLLYINALNAITQDLLRPADSKGLIRSELPSWDFYENKLKRLMRWFSTTLLLYSLPLFLFVGNKNLAFKIGFAPSFMLVFLWYYVRSLYLMEYLQKTIERNIELQRDPEKYTNLFETNWTAHRKKTIQDKIIVSMIILVAVSLYFLGVTDLFRGIVLFWAAFLYPGLRETIDVNLLLNKFSSAAKNRISADNGGGDVDQ